MNGGGKSVNLPRSRHGDPLLLRAMEQMVTWSLGRRLYGSKLTETFAIARFSLALQSHSLVPRPPTCREITDTPSLLHARFLGRAKLTTRGLGMVIRWSTITKCVSDGNVRSKVL